MKWCTKCIYNYSSSNIILKNLFCIYNPFTFITLTIFWWRHFNIELLLVKECVHTDLLTPLLKKNTWVLLLPQTLFFQFLHTCAESYLAIQWTLSVLITQIIIDQKMYLPVGKKVCIIDTVLPDMKRNRDCSSIPNLKM